MARASGAGSSSPAFSPASRARLTRHDLARFAGESLFDRIGRAVCDAGCLPRKELYEAWEVARRARRALRGGRVVDVGGGHGLLGLVMLLLDDTSPAAVVVDPSPPASAARVQRVMIAAWPRLEGRIATAAVGIDDLDLRSDDVVVSCHGCGALTDRILTRAASARAAVAVLPCCHDVETCDTGGLLGWLDAPLAIDVSRVAALRRQGYEVRTQTIPAAITPKNRLLIGVPAGAARKRSANRRNPLDTSRRQAYS